jgi:hypothetical protein
MKKLSLVAILAASLFAPVAGFAAASTDSSQNSLGTRVDVAQADSLRRRLEPCRVVRYYCGHYVAEADLCSDGNLYLRGTDILFRCEYQE